jgi:hypothetical protein
MPELIFCVPALREWFVIGLLCKLDIAIGDTRAGGDRRPFLILSFYPENLRESDSMKTKTSSRLNLTNSFHLT